MKRTAPVEIKSVEREQDLLIEQDLIWILFRTNFVENSTVQTIPVWTVFNYFISPDDPNNFSDNK